MYVVEKGDAVQAGEVVALKRPRMSWLAGTAFVHRYRVKSFNGILGKQSRAVKATRCALPATPSACSHQDVND
ncbi:hypothetical protein [Burkholderia ubonensis]|uniref:hypothetical protein n=1 Tax=Burkholderia ubonensis TaxID=101571 RepID=UPI000ABE9639|nr:hypothetical protein [Burkholderia ubonensis]